MAKRRAHRRARPRTPYVLDPPGYPPIACFTDAIATAWALHEQFVRFNAVFVLEEQGAVTWAWLGVNDSHTPAVLADIGLSLCALDRDACSTLLVSGRGDDDIKVAAEDDIARWHEMRRDAARRGVRLLDWVMAGGEDFRSMHFTVTPEDDWPLPYGVTRDEEAS